MEWIACKNRLPEFGLPVLVYCKIYGRYITTYERILDNQNLGEWIDHEGKKGGLPPTHWMSLPQPPEE